MPDLSHTIAYNAVKGAVKNALDGHPDWAVPKDFARSVAKRAAGTLAAHCKDGLSMLASARRSGQRRRVSDMTAVSRGGALCGGHLLSFTHKEISNRIAEAHKQGDHGRFIDLVTAARIIKREIARTKE